eukprot:TRINITY_DN765_c9_g1_i1.p1 TRINITY_DN765_c9_g1~~TRINITY_DN765_c9_g1_i1.p1  ORF type:complete len:115 (+),score=1.06 TRINITY_DN765_c9_g1_i1:450-794(+)
MPRSYLQGVSFCAAALPLFSLRSTESSSSVPGFALFFAVVFGTGFCVVLNEHAGLLFVGGGDAISSSEWGYWIFLAADDREDLREIPVSGRGTNEASAIVPLRNSFHSIQNTST